jgi:transposase-like protein
MTKPTAYCAQCKRVVAVTLIRGHNGARDLYRCDTCGRTWPT